jgi:hypothetical protein
LREVKFDARSDAMMLEGACVNLLKSTTDGIIQHGCQVEEPIINHTIGAARHEHQGFDELADDAREA